MSAKEKEWISFEIKAEDEDGPVLLRFVGEDLGDGAYSTDKGDAILVRDDDPYTKWSQVDRDKLPSQFVDDVWDTVSSYGNGPSEAREIAERVLFAFGMELPRRVIDL